MAAYSTTETMLANQGEGTAPLAPPAPPALQNIMDMPEALITVLLEHMFRSGLTHSDRAALGCVNKCLHRLCRALGSFHSLQLSTENLHASLQDIAGNPLIDGLKIEGVGIDYQHLGPEDPVDGQQLLCIALGAMAIAPTASQLQALYINTSTGLLHGAALGSLRALRSLQALKIHSLHATGDLGNALDHLTSLTLLDVQLEPPTIPKWCAEDADRYLSNWGGDSVGRFPASLLKCTCLRQLSLHSHAQGTVYFGDVPAGFGDLTALETVSLIRCEVTRLPTTITRLTRLTSLTVENNDDGYMEVPEEVCYAMPNLRHISRMLSRALA